jgi:hypothetical protein
MNVFKEKMVIKEESFYEIQTQLSKGNIVQEIQPSK